jgi:hypothetical protein
MGRIAGIAAWVAFTGAAVMAALTVAGVIHLRRTRAGVGAAGASIGTPS